MPIANVTLNNTFDEWRTVTNQIITFVNEVDAGNLTKFYSNSAVLTVTENVARNGKNFITLNTSSNVLDTSTLNVATANAVNVVFAALGNTDARLRLVSNDANTINAVANAAYTHANLSFAQANTARVHANAAHVTANAGFGQANTARDIANLAFVQANAAFTNANTVMISAQVSFTVANAGFLHANAAFNRANTANITADRAWNHANAAFSNANTILVTAQSAFFQANSGFAQANTARDRANAAYDLASTVGGSTAPIIEANKAGFDQANAAFARANTANITADRAWNHANAAFANANTVMVTAQSAFAAANAALPNTSGVSFNGSLNLPSGNLVVGSATSTMRMKVQSAGPLTALGVYGDGAAITWDFNGTSDSYLDSNTIYFRSGYPSQAERMRIDPSGNVIIRGSDASVQLGLGTWGSDAYVGTISSDAMFLRTSGVDRLRIGSTGGTTFYGTNEINVASSSADFYLNSFGGSGKKWLLNSSTSGNFTLYDSTGSNTRIVVSSSGGIFMFTANGNTTHQFTTSSGGNQFSMRNPAGTTVATMYTDANHVGMVGYQGNFYITNASTDDPDIIFQIGPSFTEYMRVANSGNVGIGTSSPAYKLDVTGAVNASALLVNGQSIGALFTGIATANAAFNRANTANITADRAWNHANAGFDKANAALPNVSGSSFAGNLQIPAGNVSIGDGATQGIRLTVNAWTGVANVIPQAEFMGGSQFVQLNANTSGGAWNDLMLNRDISIIYSRGTFDDGANLVIGPWTDSSFGYKQDGAGRHGFNTSNPLYTIDANGSANISGSLLVGGSATVGGVDVVPYIRTVGTAGNNYATLAIAPAFASANAGQASGNAGMLQANTARVHANAAFEQANTARVHANSGYAFSNSSHSIANLAFTHANNAYAKANAALPLTGGTMTGQLNISYAAPLLYMQDTDAAAASFWLHVNSNQFYVLADRDSSGTWELPHALQLDAVANTAYAFGSKIWTEGNDGPGSGLNADTLDGIESASFALDTKATAAFAKANTIGTLGTQSSSSVSISGGSISGLTSLATSAGTVANNAFRSVMFSTTGPSGGSSGDIYLVYV